MKRNEKDSSFAEKEKVMIKNKHFEGEVEKTTWKVDKNMPILTQDRKYIEKYLGDEDV